MRMPTKSDVFVIKEGSTYLVRPGFVVVHRQSFRLRNFSGHDIRISLPKAFEARGTKGIRVGSGRQQTVKVPGFLPPGVYRYKVEVAGVPRRKRFARGNSAPIIIIDR
jgi:hypothetical protein